MNEEELRAILEDFFLKVQDLLKNEVKPAVIETEVAAPVSNLILVELISHEAIVLEAYKDSVGVWTWGVGVTDRSGHRVQRYKDNPQTIQKVIEIFKWLVETKYLPAVLKAFDGHSLTETELAAALSFHYNTGAIGKASWVKSFLKGDIPKARQEIMNWRTPKEIIPRREKERDLFFDGRWSNDGMVTIYPVKKPSYTPNFRQGRRIDISKEL